MSRIETLDLFVQLKSTFEIHEIDGFLVKRVENFLVVFSSSQKQQVLPWCHEISQTKLKSFILIALNLFKSNVKDFHKLGNTST